jgi:hypothetical protein
MNPFRRVARPRCIRCRAYLELPDALVTVSGVVCASCHLYINIEEFERETERTKIWTACVDALKFGVTSLILLCDPILLPGVAVWQSMVAMRALSAANARDQLQSRYALAWLMAISGMILGVARPLTLLFLWRR